MAVDTTETLRPPGSEVSAPPGGVPHLSPDERRALGRDARRRVPRERHAELDLATDRRPLELLEEQEASRVTELVPIRRGRMTSSPFAFFRGAALVMASDLATTPRTDFVVQACGDAHLTNFGVFGTPERRLVFDVNDFDETAPAPWEWDVKRLAASVTVAARDRGFTEKESRLCTQATVAGYRRAMTELAAMGNLGVWYAHLDADVVLPRLAAQLTSGVRKRAAKTLAKARTRDSMQALQRLTREVDGQRRIVSDPPLVVPVEELLPPGASDTLVERMHQVLRSYRRSLEPHRRALLEQFRFVQLARKVVGVGSVGTRTWVALLVGRDDQDPLLLQVKEAEASVLERFAGPSLLDNHGMRVVLGQRLMQASTDIFLGWDRVNGMDGRQRDFYFRQLRDWKGSFDPDGMVPAGLTVYGQVCGWTLAKAHARTGDRIAIAAYLGRSDVFDRAVTAFAEQYANVNSSDHQALRQAVASGRLPAQTGV